MQTIKRFIIIIFIIQLAIISNCTQKSSTKEGGRINNIIDGVKFEPGDWEFDLPAGQAGTSLGNHRAVLKVNSTHQAAWAHIPWRRCDLNPNEKQLVLISAQTGEEIQNKIIVNLNNEFGDIVFQPAGAETYYLYYMPYKTTGGYYPVIDYLPPKDTAEPDWVNQIGKLSTESMQQLAKASVLSIQSVNEFHSFFPMEIIATKAEQEQLLGPSPKTFHLFPEYRDYPIRMQRNLPKHWVSRGLIDTFKIAARRGEYYTFQIGVFAANQRLDNLNVSLDGFKSEGGTESKKNRFQLFQHRRNRSSWQNVYEICFC